MLKDKMLLLSRRLLLLLWSGCNCNIMRRVELLPLGRGAGDTNVSRVVSGSLLLDRACITCGDAPFQACLGTRDHSRCSCGVRLLMHRALLLLGASLADASWHSQWLHALLLLCVGFHW